LTTRVTVSFSRTLLYAAVSVEANHHDRSLFTVLRLVTAVICRVVRGEYGDYLLAVST